MDIFYCLSYLIELWCGTQKINKHHTPFFCGAILSYVVWYILYTQQRGCSVRKQP